MPAYNSPIMSRLLTRTARLLFCLGVVVLAATPASTKASWRATIVAHDGAVTPDLDDRDDLTVCAPPVVTVVGPQPARITPRVPESAPRGERGINQHLEARAPPA